MSCHTWFSHKVERSLEEARRLFIENQEGIISSCKRMIDNPNDECRLAYEWSQEYLENSLEMYERQLRMVKKGLCGVAVMNKQPGELSYYIPGKGFFVDCDDFHDLFRIGGYPPDEIFSKEECLSFIENNKDKIQMLDDTYEQLDEFWNKYPDGHIHFG